MRVLNISNKISADGGGVARRIRDFSPHLARNENEVYFAGAEPDSAVYDGVENTFFCPELGGENPSQDAPSLEDIVTQKEIDIIHVHEVAYTDAYAPLADRMPLAVHLQNYRMWCPAQDWFYARQEEPCTLSLGWKCIPNAYTKRCNDRHPKRLIRSLIECGKRRELIQEGVHFIAGSDYMRDVAHEYGDIPRAQISVVSNAIDRNRFDDNGSVPSLEVTLNSGFILYAGRFAKSKGIEHLLEAYSKLSGNRPRLVLAGGGHYREAIEEKVESLGLQSSVVFAGWQSGAELVWLYKNARMVVVPSVWQEVFGNVGLEAMAAKKPVVAYDVGGISQWLVDGETGYLVPPKDEEELSARIQELLENTEQAEQMGRRGYERFRDHFTVREQAQNLLGVYEDVIDNA